MVSAWLPQEIAAGDGPTPQPSEEREAPYDEIP